MGITLVLVYWLMAALYGTTWSLVKQTNKNSEIIKDIMVKCDLIGMRYGLNKDVMFQMFLMGASIVWPISVTIDLAHVLNHKN